MPCEETSSEIVVTIDGKDRLVEYSYAKINCGKDIGIDKLYKSFVVGKVIDELAEVGFYEVMKACPVKVKEEEFLLYLEWKALREALREYLGRERDGEDIARYKVAEIINEDDSVIIKMIISPPDNMPEIIPCSKKELH